MATEWLKIMLEEIQRRQDDARRAEEEEQKRKAERKTAPGSNPAPGAVESTQRGGS